MRSDILRDKKLNLSGSVAHRALHVPDMPSSVWTQPDILRSQFNAAASRFFECDSVLAVTGIDSGISALARLFQTWYGPMRVVLAEPCFDQWDVRFRRASHIVLDWPVDFILEGEIPECDVVVLARPVNPTGEVISIQSAKKLAQTLRDQGGWLILDEAYVDCLDIESYCSFIEEVPAIVLRSMAPFSGLAGANIAFVCGTRKVCQALLEEVGTQAVSAPQWWLALKYFESEAWRQSQSDSLEQATTRLKQLWSTYLPSDAALNVGGYFVAITHDECSKWAAGLEAAGVLVRLYETEDQQIVRCGLPLDETAWQKLSRALQQTLGKPSPQAPANQAAGSLTSRP
ncbi:MAG: aminotransferase class I/II-fold pyridoxal phosphate-dependent enzyme [Limnobacter sp.]|nr:aminotransferase class I/II-fold pyridoxal phosphate-dependent enzyme [Limnobacter sp.]